LCYPLATIVNMVATPVTSPVSSIISTSHFTMPLNIII
jgi:hypothetical protein